MENRPRSSPKACGNISAQRSREIVSLDIVSYVTHVLFDFDGLRKIAMVHPMDFRHVSLPVVLSRKRLTARTRIVTTLDCTVELLLLLVPVIDVPL
jgi:hypothetical protein